MVYRKVQLDFTPEIKVFVMLFERCHSKNSVKSIKQHIKYFNLRSNIAKIYDLIGCINTVCVIWSFLQHSM